VVWRAAHHRSAQAHLALGDAAAARIAIDAAIAGNRDERCPPTFLHQRWLIRRAQKDADAIADLREAYRLCKLRPRLNKLVT
jgi:hypothetical protein